MRAGDALAAMRALPFRDAAAITGPGRALVLAPHADDEVLGCGGLLLQLAAAGADPAILVLTDGTGSHPNSAAVPLPALLALRETEARRAAALLGVAEDRIGFLRLRDTAAPMEGPAFDAAVAAVAAAAARWGCTTLLASWRADPHCDHLAAHLIAAAAARAASLRHLAYPVWGWTLADDTELGGMRISGARLDIAAQLAAKRAALDAHASQLGGVITDDPGGFHLEPAVLARMLHGYEVFLDTP